MEAPTNMSDLDSGKLTYPEVVERLKTSEAKRDELQHILNQQQSVISNLILQKVRNDEVIFNMSLVIHRLTSPKP